MTTLANKFSEEVLTVDYTVASAITVGSVLVFGPGVKYEVTKVKPKGRMIHVDAFRPDKKQERTFKLARNSKVGLLVQEPELEEGKAWSKGSFLGVTKLDADIQSTLEKIIRDSKVSDAGKKWATAWVRHLIRKNTWRGFPQPKKFGVTLAEKGQLAVLVTSLTFVLDRHALMPIDYARGTETKFADESVDEAQYRYVTSCVNACGADIEKMTDAAKQITYATFRKEVGPEMMREIEDGFGYDKHLRMKNDWAVRFYRSKYRGKPCVFIDHSAIEYVYTKESAEESVQEDYKSAPKMGGKQIIKIGTFGRFTAYSASEGGKQGVFTKQQALDQNLQDTLLANVDIDIPHFLKKVDAAMSKLKMPKHDADVVFSDYPGSKKSVSGWMYPSIKSTVFLNRVLSPTALNKYKAWKGPRSPHTLVHEYAHDVWYQVLSPKQRQAVTDYYDKHVKPNKAEAVKKLISPTDYGASVDTEWWAEIVAYSIHPGRVAQEVLDFIVDVMTNKFDTASTKAAAPAKSKEATISTPAPKDEPTSPVGKLIAAGSGTIKKEIGDYKLDPRPDGSVRIIPADKGKAHDGGVMAKLAMALGFNRHGKSPFKVRTSTGSQGGIVLFPESETDAHMNAVIAEIEDDEPWDYVDEAGLATMLSMVGLAPRERRVPLTHIAKLPVGTEFELRRATDPNTKSFWLHYRRTANGLALLDARGETVTAPNREAMLLDYAIELVRQGAKVRAPQTR